VLKVLTEDPKYYSSKLCVSSGLLESVKNVHAICFGCTMRMCAAGENKSNIAIHKKMDEFENGKYSMKKLLKETTNDVFSQVAKAYVVGIPKEHPLCRDNKIKYICMARGPNMNENRDECLHGDYAIGERMLKATYESMFNAIAQIYRKQYKGENHQFPVYQQPTGVVPRPKYGFRNALLDYCGQ